MGANFSSANIPELRQPKTLKLHRLPSALDSPESPGSPGATPKVSDAWAESNPFEDKEEERAVDAAASGISIAPAEEDDDDEAEEVDPRYASTT